MVLAVVVIEIVEVIGVVVSVSAAVVQVVPYIIVTIRAHNRKFCKGERQGHKI